MRLDKLARRSLAAFSGYDSGFHDLPSALLDARTRFLAVAEQADADLEPGDPEQVLQQVAIEVAAGTGTADPAAVLAARAEVAAHTVTVAIYQRAADLAAGRLSQAIADHADVVLGEYLQPAVAEIMGELGKVAPALAALTDADPKTLLTAGKPAAAAWLRAEELVRRYDAIRGTRGAVLALAGDRPDHDDYNLFTEVRNLPVIWADVATSRLPISQLIATPPWPSSSTKSRLLWYIANGADVWCPTIDQQDRAFLATFGARLERHRQNQHAAAGWRAFGENLVTPGSAVHTPAEQA